VIRLTKSLPVELLGEAPPRVLVEPRGARANSWEDVADLSARAGIELDSWQEVILGAAMGERADATWAAKRVGVSVPRQNGKSQLLVARALAGVLLFGEQKIVVSAHQQDTAREAFSKLVEIIEADGNGWLMDRVKPNGIMNAINREAVKFKNGATVQFKARTSAGGRGFSSDCLLLDEAQRLKRSAWVSINSTMSAMQNPQVWLLGTPPTREDDGEVFESIRSAAVDGVSSAAAWAEWGADPAADDYDPASEITRWRANPAWNTRINHEIVQGEFESYTDEEFAQDRLGIWLSEIGAGTRAISVAQWTATEAKKAPEGMKSYAVAFSLDGTRLSLAGAVAHGEDQTHVELIDASTDQGGLAPLADWFCERDEAGTPRWRRAGAIVIGGSAGAGVLKQLLVERRVNEKRIRIVTTPQYLQACAMFYDAIDAKSATHLKHEGQAVLDDSISIVDRDKRGGWMPTVADGDETPTEAVSLALWGARTSKRKVRVEGEQNGVIL
jgi:hypothetical protein